MTMGSCHQVVPRLITFDVTGTLLMTKIKQHYVEVALSCGYVGQLDGPRLEKTFRKSFKRLEVEHPIYGRHTGLGWERWWRTLVHEVFQDQDRGIDKSKLDMIASGLIDCYSSKHCWHKYPGTLELLDSLHGRRDLVLGVVSNFDERLGIVLDSTGLHSYFAFVLTSYGFGIQKPSPAIFQEALRLASLGLSREIRPEEAVHVGDRLDNDFLGARGAGWNAVLIDRDGKNEEDQRLGSRDVVVDFRGLKEYFDRLFDKKAVCDR